jgi:protein-disulfide isomerase
MLRRFLTLIIPLSWLLAACQGAAVTEALDTPATATLEPTPSATAQADPTGTPLPQTRSAATPSVQAECSVVSRQPTPGPTEKSLFPPVSASDWVEGPDTAAITIIEYSDFQ